jgi:protein-S-isoprenylcysteine O-methyltransferase Ste14
MTIYSRLIAALWLVLLVVWLVSARHTKRSVNRTWAWRREIGLRAAIVVLILLALHFFGFNHAMRVLRLYSANRSPLAGIIGVALTAIGVGLAILARIHLGPNWGLPMSRKAEPELITTGPYAVIRHPIYTGILLGVLGSAIGISIVWMIAFVLLAPYFIYSARHEEQLMLEQFPERYAAYMHRTNMLLPYIL